MNSKISFLLAAGLLALTVGCANRDETRTYEVSKTGPDFAENKTVQEHIGPDRKRTINKQTIREKVKCVGRDGKTIPVTTMEECRKHKGKIIDEVTVEEVTVER